MIRYLVPAGVLALITASAGTALAHWPAQGTGRHTATTATLAAPTGVAATAGTVRWRAARLSDGRPATGYRVIEYRVIRILPGGRQVAACGGRLVTRTTCVDEPGPYRYRVTAVYRTWTATSTTSAPAPVPVRAPVPSPPVTSPPAPAPPAPAPTPSPPPSPTPSPTPS